MKTVLIVDDESQTRKILGLIVKNLGYIPLYASSGELAVDIYNDNQDISMIFTDYQMDGMTGLELISAIRSRNDIKSKSVTIVVLSAYIKISELTKILELGGDGFLAKPFKKEEIAEYLHRFLERK